MSGFRNPAPLADDVHAAIAAVGQKCPDTPGGSLCFDIAEFLVERGWAQIDNGDPS